MELGLRESFDSKDVLLRDLWALLCSYLRHHGGRVRALRPISRRAHALRPIRRWAHALRPASWRIHALPPTCRKGISSLHQDLQIYYRQIEH